MIRLLSFPVLLLVTLLTGCAYHLHPFSPPTVVKLQLQSERPEVYAVRVTAKEPPARLPGYAGWPGGFHSAAVPPGMHHVFV